MNIYLSDSNGCLRTIVVKAISLTDPDFTSESVSGWLSKLLGTPFVLLQPFGEALNPEYVLVVRFEKNEDGKFKTFSSNGEVSFIEDITNTTTPIPVSTRSIMELQLQFCGGYLAQNGYHPSSGFNLESWGNNTKYSWRTTDTSMSLDVHKELMAEKLSKVIPIDEKVLWDYEQHPFKCKIDPDEIEVKPDEEIEIRLYDWEDRKGRLIQETNITNRLIVEVETGEILNDENDYTPIIKYKAPPAPILEDVIHVYNSYDILDHEKSVLPLDETLENIEIAKKKIRVKYDLSAEIDVKVNWDDDNDNNTEKGYFEVKIQGELRKSSEYSNPGIYVYLPEDMKATYNYQNEYRIKNPQCPGEGYEESASGEMVVTNPAHNPMAVHMKLHSLKSQFERDAPEDYNDILNQMRPNMPKGLGLMQKEMMKSMPKAKEMVEKLSAVMPFGLGLTTLRGIPQGMGILDDRYELMMVFTHLAPQTCIKNWTRCVYDMGLDKRVPKLETAEEPIANNFNLYINSKIDENKEMSGSHQWEAHDYDVGSNISINYMAHLAPRNPLRPEPSPGGKVNLDVSWNIREI